MPHTHTHISGFGQHFIVSFINFGLIRVPLTPSTMLCEGRHQSGEKVGASTCPPTVLWTAWYTSSAHVIWLAYVEPKHNGSLVFSSRTPSRYFSTRGWRAFYVSQKTGNAVSYVIRFLVQCSLVKVSSASDGVF